MKKFLSCCLSASIFLCFIVIAPVQSQTSRSRPKAKPAPTRQPAQTKAPVNEIFNLKLGAPLVMLSACETGLGTEKRGEGVIGLTRAFMYAGAPTVGVSLWSVSDNSTAQLMTDFYKRVFTGQGMSPSAALRSAQTAMIAGKKYSAPFYWAPFVLVGEWR